MRVPKAALQPELLQADAATLDPRQDQPGEFHRTLLVVVEMERFVEVGRPGLFPRWRNSRPTWSGRIERSQRLPAGMATGPRRIRSRVGQQCREQAVGIFERA